MTGMQLTGSQQPGCKHLVHSLLCCCIKDGASSVSLSALVPSWHQSLWISHHEVAEKCPRSEEDSSQAAHRARWGFGVSCHCVKKRSSGHNVAAHALHLAVQAKTDHMMELKFTHNLVIYRNNNVLLFLSGQTSSCPLKPARPNKYSLWMIGMDPHWFVRTSGKSLLFAYFSYRIASNSRALNSHLVHWRAGQGGPAFTLYPRNLQGWL